MKKLLFRLLAWYLRNSPIEKGRYRLVHFAGPIGREIGRELGRRTVRTKYGFTMELDLSDWIPQHIYLTGEFEATTSIIAKSLVKPGDTVVDVGANIGYFSLLFAQCVGRSGTVYAFEPVPRLVLNLKRNLGLNKLNCVNVTAVALSDRRGKARFYEGPADNSGLSSLREPRQSSASFEVELAPFDELIDDHSKVTLVKIDVEGAELQVLRGMERMLRATHPSLLLEVTDHFLAEMGDSSASLLKYIRSLQYIVYMIDDRQVSLLNESSKKLPKQWNALCTSRPLTGDRGSITLS